MSLRTPPGADTRKYRLGNQAEEYALSECYLGWKPDGYHDIHDWTWSQTYNQSSKQKGGITTLLLVGPGSEKIELIVYQLLIKDAFPLDFYGEERSKQWSSFAIVSIKDISDEKFIIPLH